MRVNSALCCHHRWFLTPKQPHRQLSVNGWVRKSPDLLTRAEKNMRYNKEEKWNLNKVETGEFSENRESWSWFISYSLVGEEMQMFSQCHKLTVSISQLLSNLWKKNHTYDSRRGGDVTYQKSGQQEVSERRLIKMPLPSHKTWLAPPGTAASPCCNHRYDCCGSGSSQLWQTERKRESNAWIQVSGYTKVRAHVFERALPCNE